MNSGVNKLGYVILADINGLSFDKSEVAILIRNKVWLNKHSYTYLDDGNLKEYFKVKMNENLTLENLELYWKNLI